MTSFWPFQDEWTPAVTIVWQPCDLSVTIILSSVTIWWHLWDHSMTNTQQLRPKYDTFKTIPWRQPIEWDHCMRVLWPFHNECPRMWPLCDTFQTIWESYDHSMTNAPECDHCVTLFRLLHNDPPHMWPFYDTFETIPWRLPTECDHCMTLLRLFHDDCPPNMTIVWPFWDYAMTIAHRMWPLYDPFETIPWRLPTECDHCMTLLRLSHDDCPPNVTIVWHFWDYSMTIAHRMWPLYDPSETMPWRLPTESDHCMTLLRLFHDDCPPNMTIVWPFWDYAMTIGPEMTIVWESCDQSMTITHRIWQFCDHSMTTIHWLWLLPTILWPSQDEYAATGTIVWQSCDHFKTNTKRLWLFQDRYVTIVRRISNDCNHCVTLFWLINDGNFWIVTNVWQESDTFWVAASDWNHCLWSRDNSVSHYYDIIMSAMASQITSVSIVYTTVCSGSDERKHQSSASLAFVRGIPRDRWIPRTKGQ